MLYSILIYGSEDRADAMTDTEQREMLERHADLRRELRADDRIGPVLRLAPREGRTVRRYKDRRHITDGPFAETKEQLMGIYILDCETWDDAIAAAERLSFDSGVFEIRPIVWFDPGVIPARIPD